jgi:SAM-dependent methyltransferase
LQRLKTQENIERPGAAATVATVTFDTLALHAAARYRATSITAWQFARGKLRGDPVYRTIWDAGWLHAPGAVLDLGCGQGLLLALVCSARELAASGRLAGNLAPAARPLVGIETRPRMARLARDALGQHASILAADARTTPLPAARVIAVLDVFNMMPAADQEALLDALVAKLEPGGLLLVRDADAAAGWRFRAVALGNRIKALTLGYSSRGFHFRTAAAWRACFERRGLHVEARPMGTGTPFGNVLFVAQKAAVNHREPSLA